MKEYLKKILTASLKSWAPLPDFEIERPKVKFHGELATNLAMLLAKTLKRKPADIAEEICRSLKDPEGWIASATVAGGGFVNFVLKKTVWQESLKDVMVAGKHFGSSTIGSGKKVLIEFISANPTGPVHIGNARGGPLGDVMASLLTATGHEVTREYYVNDVGGQIDKLGESILFYLKSASDGPDSDSSQVGYQGEYVKDLAVFAKEKLGKKIPTDETEAIRVLGQFGIDRMMEMIREDCETMGIRFDSWIHERTILVSGETEKVLESLKAKKVVLEKENAQWLTIRSDETMGVVRGRKDSPPDFSEASGFASAERIDRECVLVRSDGRPTYFANDIAYHAGKYRRGFDRIINVWGSNHHGHVPRLQAAVKSLGFDPAKMETILYQYVRVKRGSEAVKMSKRGGNFVTAREVLDEVGCDAFRFFLLMRAPESHLDFDLELARRHTQENPVYYVQYAHARLASIFRKAQEMGLPPLEEGSVDLSKLDLPEEIEMIQLVNEFPEEVERAALRREPHRIPFYLLELSKAFQSYYTKAKEDPHYRVIQPDQVDTSRAKLYLCATLKLTLSQGLKLLGVSAPEAMSQDS